MRRALRYGTALTAMGVRRLLRRRTPSEPQPQPQAPHPIPPGTPPIDVVFTWVDDSDPQWRAAFDAALPAHAHHAEAANPSRYRNRDELRYALRSIDLFAPWVRQVFVVTAGHRPPWLTGATVVPHDAILPAQHLPTFNSHAIEARLHHIEGLAEHFLYCNDDFFLGRPVDPGLFFTAEGDPHVFPDPNAPIPAGPATPADRPVDAAAKNGRDAVEQATGFAPTHKLRHSPYPLRRSLMADMEERFADELERTLASRFRRPTDVAPASSLAPWLAVATGRGTLTDLDSLYVNIATRWAPIQMDELLARRDRDVFCLNETDLDPRRERRVSRRVRRFLDAYFPSASRFETEGPSSP